MAPAEKLASSPAPWTAPALDPYRLQQYALPPSKHNPLKSHGLKLDTGYTETNQDQLMGLYNPETVDMDKLTKNK